MRASLLPLDGGRPIDIQKDVVVIGRQASCDLRLKHKTISKLHCVLVKTDGLMLLRDLGSTNGCQVNGRRVLRAALLPNDVLGLANLRFRVRMGPDEPAGHAKHERTEQLGGVELDDLAGSVEPPQNTPLPIAPLESAAPPGAAPEKFEASFDQLFPRDE